MNLLRIILIGFAIYFIKRLFNFYRFVKNQQQQLAELQKKSNTANQTAEGRPIDAEFKVID